MQLGALAVVYALLVSFASAASFMNPLKQPFGSDPFMVYVGGFYYLLTTTTYDIEMTRATTLEGLKTATAKVFWTDATANRCCHMWAPEVWLIDGIWYIYYTAGESPDHDGQRPMVLKGGADIWDDSYSYLGQLSDEWGIDGTVIFFEAPWESSYFVWSCLTSNKTVQSICIAPFTSPSTIGASSVISTPTEAWEEIGANINEAPAALYHEGLTFLTYSASNCNSSSYQLGLLKWNNLGDPTSMESWTKTGPIFSSANGNIGTGHNGFFKSPDHTETWMVYHADRNVSGACDPTRYTMAKKIAWNIDGSPNLGQAPALTATLTGPSGEPA